MKKNLGGFTLKKAIWLLCLLLLLVPTQVFAHSKLTESYPAADATLGQSPEKITIAFNTTIASMSTFKLFNENNEEQPVDNIVAAEHELSGDITQKLDSGIYSVQYNIVGADGHAIEGSYSFTVAAAPETTVTPSEEPEVTATPEPSIEPTPSTTADVEPANDKKDNSASWPYIIIGVIIVGAVIFALRKRK